MSYDYLVHYLKSLKSIKPDDGFLLQSRNIILSQTSKPSYVFRLKNELLNVLKFSFAVGLTAVMFLSLGGKLFPKNNIFVASLNNKNLVKESLKADIDIQLAEAKYYKETTAQVTLALNEIIKDENNPSVTRLLKKSLK